MRAAWPGLMLISAAFAADSKEGIEFFEARIQPVLARRCIGCHGAKAMSGGLRLDSRTATRKGGTSGPLFNFEAPIKSLLMQVLLHEGPIKMPPKQQLDADVLVDFLTWVKMGAPDPRD